MFVAALLGASLLVSPGIFVDNGPFANRAIAADAGDPSATGECCQAWRPRSRTVSLGEPRPKRDVAGPEGTSALIWSAYRNDVEMADLLLRAGADVKAAIEYGATALYAAASNADPAMAVRLLKAGADANAHLVSGETPLMEAARRDNLATLRALLSAGAIPNAQESNGGQTALMWGAAEGHA